MNGRTVALGRFGGLLFLYATTLLASLWLSFLLRFDFSVAPEYREHLATVLTIMVAAKLVLLFSFGQFGSLLSYFSVHDAEKILIALTLAALAAFAAWSLFGIAYAPPRAVIVTDLLFSFVAVCALRLGFRLLREGYFRENPVSAGPRRAVAIIGAGDVGASLAKELMTRRGLGMNPVAFYDDDRAKWGTSIHGVPVRGSPDSLPLALREHKIDEAVIAMPKAPAKRIRELVKLLHQVGVKCETVPSIQQLVTGQLRVSQIRAVEIQDLLGRPPVDLQAERIKRLIEGSVVMVTGAGGSIGGELSRQIAAHAPQRLLLVERSEFHLFQIEQELLGLGYGGVIVPLVADILDEPRMSGLLERFRPTLLFHAAAHKHVPMMEHQAAEAVRNNALGTRLLADLARRHGLERFILISTDKAINPTSVMGASKRLAELYLQALQGQPGAATKFMAVRFGNVLGSSGSVIPTFHRQITAGGPLTVTHPEMTRYFMTVQEAAGLVLQSATLGLGGEVFILDMGKPARIVDIARQLIELSGLEVDSDIEIRFIGLRPGEKLHEELNHNTENSAPTEHPKVFRFQAASRDFAAMRDGLAELERALATRDNTALKGEIQRLVPEYRPYLPPA